MDEALLVTCAALDAWGRTPTAEELQVCEGLCTLVTAQQASQDQALFPRMAAEHPELGPVLRSLRQDHAEVARLVRDVRSACAERQQVDVLRHKVDQLRAALLLHFEDERRRLGPDEVPPPG